MQGISSTLGSAPQALPSKGDKMSITHIPFYPSDWLAGTRGMMADETGVYITLIARMYEMAGPIERNDERLYRVCGCNSKRHFVKVLKYLIGEGKVYESGNDLFNKRAAKEINKVVEKSSKARAAAQERWDDKSNKINETHSANAMRTHSERICQSEPKPEPKPFDDDDVAREAKNGIEILAPREQILIAMGHDKSGATATGRMVGNPADMLELGRWQDDLGLSMQEVIGVIEGIRAGSNKPPPTVFRYYEKPMQEFAGRKNAPALTPTDGVNYGNGNYNGSRSRNGGASGAHAGLIAGFAANAERFAAEDAAASRDANQASTTRLVAKKGG